MKKFLFLFLLSTFLKPFAQTNSHHQFNCDDFNFSMKSNTRNEIEFISEEQYFSLIKDSISKSEKPVIQENKELTLEFQKKFPNKITEHCINAKNFSGGVFEETSFCNDRQKIFLITKNKNFYIFKLNAFEIDSYILFNTEDQTIYMTENFPLILDNGKTVYDIGHSYGGSSIINYEKFSDNGNVDYFELSIPYGYRIINHNIIKKVKNSQVILELIKYDIKETSPNHYENDKNIFCRKFLIIN